MTPTPLADVKPVCIFCNRGCGFTLIKLPGGGPFAARCHGCGEHNDPAALGFHTDGIVDYGPFEERCMAKAKSESPLEALAKRIKEGTQKRKVRRGPTYVFLEQKLGALLKRHGLKIGAAALEAGIDAGLVSDAVKGKNVRLSTALKLATVAGMSVEDLFGKPTIFNSAECPQSIIDQVAGNETGPITDDIPFEGDGADSDPE